MALKYDLDIDKGATYIKHLTWYEPAPDPNPAKLQHGAPKDLTGYKGELMIREDITDLTPQVTLNSLNGGIVISNGTITIRIEAASTEAFTFDSGVYDLKLTAPDGTVVRLVEGKTKVNPDVTRV
jgi:hypothetical protein